MQSNSSQVVLQEMLIENVTKNVIRGITSCAISDSRRLLLITTAHGFVLTNLISMTYTRYENKNSPFYTKEDVPNGCQLGSILESRSEVAVVPNFFSNSFNATSVYIYDYGCRMMLSKFNFNLPIVSFSLSNTHLIVSNNKRIVLYDYLKGRPGESEEYYLKLYRSQSNTFIRYLDLFCHLCDEKERHYGRCECGRYSYSKGEHMKMVYMRIGFSQNVKSRILYLYDHRTHTNRFFYEQKPYHPNFHFALTHDAKYLTIAEDDGRRINVYNLHENCLFSVLYLGREPKSIVNLDVITLPGGAQWVVAARAGEGALATMHFYKLARSPATEQLPSRYRRKFRLYRQTMRDYAVFENPEAFIEPQHFLWGCKLMSLSLVGDYCELIDLNKAGLHDEGTVNDYKSIEECLPPSLTVSDF